MLKSLSILLPSYNNDCRPLITALHSQAEALGDKLSSCEIVVYDDCSTDTAKAEANRSLCDNLEHCRFVRGNHNVGRSAARNRLVELAQYEWLIFIDSDLSPLPADFLAVYAEADSLGAEAVVGGLKIHAPTDTEPRSCLRYLYELHATQSHPLSWRKRNPYAAFHVSNILIRRDVMTAHPFDVSITRYGYEDVLLGRELKDNGIRVAHTDNPVGFSRFDDNAHFLQKTEEGLQTLHDMRDALRGYSGVQTLVERISRIGLAPLLRLAFRITRGMLRRNLTGRKPSLTAFSVYRIGYYAMLCRND